ncbi:MAG: hypothetical protein JWM87_1328 [Candidatus Eremiobacteraeota bacterium]|nr:hypothetical protein [Candidatus Eremiobacteraeota bacterium]
MTERLFQTPAGIQDFPDKKKQAAFNATWSAQVGGWVQQAIALASGLFYDPSRSTIPEGTGTVQIVWNAWPNRLDFYLGSASQNPSQWTTGQLQELADTGLTTIKPPPAPRVPFPSIPAVYPLQCPYINWDPQYEDTDKWRVFGPYGPRGWLDEYCEWSVTRDDSNRMIRVDFVCENPEYWYALWAADPQLVCDIYNTTLNYDIPASQPERRITVKLEDLYLYDPRTKTPVTDPATGRPAYNPLNTWNTGPISTRGKTAGASGPSGGAMHLTSTPNTLQTELGLASTGSAQIDPAQVDNHDAQALICCAQYGQIFRNSDPHIGQSANLAVAAGANSICLADPLGLYIQMPDFDRWSFGPNADVPRDAKPSDCWHVVRGSQTLVDKVTGKPFPGQDFVTGDGIGNFLLHGVAQIPSDWIAKKHTATLADLLIDGVPLLWAGQFALTINVSLYVRPIPLNAENSPRLVPVPPSPTAFGSCLGDPTAPGPTAPPKLLQAPKQLFFENLWYAYYNTAEPLEQPASQPLAANTVIVPARVPQGSTNTRMVLTARPVYSGTPYPTVAFSKQYIADVMQSGVLTAEPTITATVTGVTTDPNPVLYTVPGDSYPNPATAFTLTLDVAADTPPGIYGIFMMYPGQTPKTVLDAAAFVPALLEVVAKKTGV